MNPGVQGRRERLGRAITTPPDMVGARLVPASPFGGPSKKVGIALAMYGGSPRVCFFARVRVWRQNRRGETWPNLPYGGFCRVRRPLLALLNAGAPGGFFATPKFPTAGFFASFFAKHAEGEGGLDLRAIAGAVLDEVLAGAEAPSAPPRSPVKF